MEQYQFVMPPPVIPREGKIIPIWGNHKPYLEKMPLNLKGKKFSHLNLSTLEILIKYLNGDVGSIPKIICFKLNSVYEDKLPKGFFKSPYEEDDFCTYCYIINNCSLSELQNIHSFFLTENFISIDNEINGNNFKVIKNDDYTFHFLNGEMIYCNYDTPYWVIERGLKIFEQPVMEYIIIGFQIY